ncbi:hypothetical protein [Nostoc sp. FACHB-888]|uniref:hypothetical protein n=1 Tax=Nostoc sp. FACHB-888 TaxID=2692842 RepID=UPI00322094B3
MKAKVLERCLLQATPTYLGNGFKIAILELDAKHNKFGFSSKRCLRRATPTHLSSASNVLLYPHQYLSSAPPPAIAS